MFGFLALWPRAAPLPLPPSKGARSLVWAARAPHGMWPLLRSLWPPHMGQCDVFSSKLSPQELHRGFCHCWKQIPSEQIFLIFFFCFFLGHKSWCRVCLQAQLAHSAIYSCQGVKIKMPCTVWMDTNALQILFYFYFFESRKSEKT